MNEKERLRELYDYDILDTPPENFLDELVELASLVFDTPISLITFIDEDREWYKAVKGVDARGTAKANSFCKHSIPHPKEVLTVTDALEDPRFKDNPLVKGDPHIRFYAGAPLETPNGNVLGTICVIDTKPKDISDSQKDGLKILAKKVIHYLNLRKHFATENSEVLSYVQEILKLTDEIPGVIYQFRIDKNGNSSYDFFSKGISNMYPNLPLSKIKSDPEFIKNMMHPEDLPVFNRKSEESFQNLSRWEVQFRILKNDDSVEWHMGKATPRREPDGSTVWCGFFHNITRYKEYEEKMEQLAFDISHVLRKPVANLLGLTTIAEEKGLKKKQLVKYVEYIKKVSEELEQYTLRLNNTYKFKPESPRD